MSFNRVPLPAYIMRANAVEALSGLESIWDLYRPDDPFSYLGVPICLHRSRGRGGSRRESRGGLCPIYHKYSAEMISRLKGIDRDIGREIKSKRNHYVHFLLCRNIFIFPIGTVLSRTDFLFDPYIIRKSLRELRNISTIFQQYNYILPLAWSLYLSPTKRPENDLTELEKLLTSLPKCVMVIRS